MDTTPAATDSLTPETAAPTVTYKPTNGVAVTIPGLGSVPAEGIVSHGAIEKLDVFVGSLLTKIEGEAKAVETAVVDKLESAAATVRDEVKSEAAAVEAEFKSEIGKLKGLFHRAKAPVEGTGEPISNIPGTPGDVNHEPPTGSEAPPPAA